MSNKKDKMLALTLATGLLVSSLPSTLTYAEVNAIDNLNSSLNISMTKNVDRSIFDTQLSDGTALSAFITSDGNKVTVILKKNDNGNWVDLIDLGYVSVQDLQEDADGGYTITTISYENDFKYNNKLDENFKLINKKLIGIEILDENISVNIEVNNNNTIVENTVLTDFVIYDSTYFDNGTVIMWGNDSNNNTSLALVTANKKVISGELIKFNGYTTVRINSVCEGENDNLIIGGYAFNPTTSTKDGFIIETDSQGNTLNERIIPASTLNTNDASIKFIIQAKDYLRIQYGDAMITTYLNSFSYADNRPVISSVELSNGRSYKVVQDTSITRSNSLNTYTVKSDNGLCQYDLDTYQDVKDIKLVPGNNNQLIVAVTTSSDLTELSIIDTTKEIEIDRFGRVNIDKPTACGTVNDNLGQPIQNIDLNSINIDSNGDVHVKTINNISQQVTVGGIVAGNAIQLKPTIPPTNSNPGVTPPAIDSKPNTNPPAIDTAPNDKPVQKPEVAPPTNDTVPNDKPVQKPEINPPAIDTAPNNKPVQKPGVNPPTNDTVTDNKPVQEPEEIIPEVKPTPDTKPEQSTPVVKPTPEFKPVETNPTVKPVIENNSNTSSESKEEIDVKPEQAESLPETGSTVSSRVISLFGLLSTIAGVSLFKKKK